MVELRLFFAAVLQRFTLELATTTADVIPVERFVVWARDDIRVKFIPRQ